MWGTLHVAVAAAGEAEEGEGLREKLKKKTTSVALLCYYLRTPPGRQHYRHEGARHPMYLYAGGDQGMEDKT